MNFEVDRYSSSWAHIALCADLTWASEPPDDFMVANQRLWAQHCRVTQALQDTIESQSLSNNHCNLSEQRLVQENVSGSRKSAKDVIPESRLAQFYGNFYYDEVRENCYTCPNERTNSRYNSNSCENSDLTECWMLPEVEYWFRKLMDNSDRCLVPRRRRQYKMLVDDNFTAQIHVGAEIYNIPINGHRSAASERWGASETTDEDALEAKVRSVRSLWNQSPVKRSDRVPSPPPVSRKIRARRRQPRKLTLSPPPPIYCVDDAQLHCDPNCKFQFEKPLPPQLTEYQRAMGRLSSSVQALLRANTFRCPPYRGTNIGRYAPTSTRPIRYPERRYEVWWPCKNISPRLEKLNSTLITNSVLQNVTNTQNISKCEKETKNEEPDKVKDTSLNIVVNSKEEAKAIKDNIIDDGQLPSTSNETIEELRKKRLYSTVLSSAPDNLNPVIRLSQKLAPGLIKLNPKIVFSARVRPSVDKFEELEKEALEQYKDSDESIDTKFRELEKEAVEQYSTSNSNTSCSSGNSGEKKSNPVSGAKNEDSNDSFLTKNSLSSVFEYSQNFPDLNTKKQTNSINLKNFHTPPRGEKKEHRLNKLIRNTKEKSRPASDTDYDSRDSKENHKAMRWTLPKKRHLTLYVSDFSSDEDLEATVNIKDAGPFIRNHLTGKVKMSSLGGGDLNPILRKT